MKLADVPLDAPIPTTETMYVWDEAGGSWVTWIDYVFRVLNGSAATRRDGSGDAAAATRRAPAQSPLFEKWG